MRWINKSELSSSSMSGNDAAPITDVSTGQDKKFTLSGIADWILNKFTMSLGGSTRTVKSAIDSIKTTNDAQETSISNNTSAIGTINTKLNNGDVTPTYKAGDVVSLSGIASYSGFVTGATQRVAFFIPLPKSAVGLTAAFEFVGTNCFSVRGPNGYVESRQYIDVSSDDYTVDWANVRPNGIFVRVSKSSAYTNVSNNVPVSVELIGKITFS